MGRRTFLIGAALCLWLAAPETASAQLTLDERVQALEALTSRMRLMRLDDAGNPDPSGNWAYVFGIPDEGVNLFVRNGAGATAGPVNGSGNLIVGYNEPRTSGTTEPGRTT